MSSNTFAARAGRWSAQHRKTAIFGWLAFVIAAFVIGGNLGTKTLSEKDLGVGDSGRATKITDKAFPEVASEEVFVQSKTQTATDPAYRAAVRDIEHRLAAQPNVRKIKSPYDKGNPGQISRDGHSALVNFEIAGDPDQAQTRSTPSWPRPPPRRRPIRSTTSSSSAARAPASRSTRCSPTTCTRPRRSRSRSR